MFAQQAPNLRDLGFLGVEIAPLSQVDHEIGLSPESMKSFVLENLGKELPEIEVDLATNDSIRVRIVTVKANESTVVSYVSVELIRYVSILRDEDRQVIGNALAGVWENSAILAGSADEMGPKIQAEIGKQLTAFVAEYHRQNPQDSAKVSAGCI
jgi:hypothetical protein